VHTGLSRGDRVLWAITGCVAVALIVVTALLLRQAGTFERLRQTALERPRPTLLAEIPGEEGLPRARPTEQPVAETPTPTPVPAVPERIFFTAAAFGVPEAEVEDHVDLWAVPAAGGVAERMAEGLRVDSFSVDAPWTVIDSGGEPQLVYIVGPAESMRLEALDLQSGQSEELYVSDEGRWIASPSASPDGQRLAFITHDPPPSRGFGDEAYGTLQVITTADGQLERQFERAALWASPGWSPDSRWLAVVEEGGGTRWPRVTLLPSGEGEPLVPPFDRAWQGVWSPQGQRVIAVRGQPTGGVELMSWDVASGGHEPFVLEGQEPGQLPGVIWDLAWSPDGQWLLGLAGDDWNEFSLYIVRQEGGEPLALYGEGENEDMITWHAWSADSRHIAFLTVSGGAEADAGVSVSGFVVQPDGEGLWHVNAGLVGSVAWMDWSPDGQHLTFALNSGQDEEITGQLYVVDVREQRPTLLTEGTGAIFTVLWMPSIAARD
jgi:Tol biopolymer transport system component